MIQAAEEQPKSRIRRAQALASAAILTIGLAAFGSAQDEQLIWLTAIWLMLPLGLTWWVLNLRPELDREHGEVYSLFILPLVLYAGAMFFLHGLVASQEQYWLQLEFDSLLADFARLLLLSSLLVPIFYILFISIHALDEYRKLDNHVARLILNVYTLLAGYVMFIFIYQFDFSFPVRLVLVFGSGWLLFFQGLFWWSNGSFRYSIFYSTFNALLLCMLSLPVSLWPFGYLITGFMMMLGLYVLLGITQHYFGKQLSWAVALEHIIVSIGLIVFLLSQTQWFPVS